MAIEMVVERWHQFMRGDLEGGLEGLLHDDVVFVSPIVFSPQAGKALTVMYLEAAGMTLAGGGLKDGAVSGADPTRRFRYVKEVLDGNHAVLEFETWIGDVSVNGVDIITCDDDDLITEFKVMIRPLQAVHAIHEQMKKALGLS